MRTQNQSGFTAVELLITLFVAAAFLIASYQLFAIVVSDGGQARAESRAGNVAYDYLRQYTSSASNPCVAYSPLTDSAVSVDGLSDTTVTVTITCPDYSTDELSKVEVTVNYNDPQQTVIYSTYTNGSDGTPNGEILNGLVGWWKLNGNASSSIGNANGSISNATPTTSQSGLVNGAYEFNGSSSKIDATLDVAGGDYVHTLSLWVYPRSIANKDPFSMGTAATSQYTAIEFQSGNTYWYFYNNDTTTPSSNIPLNQWSLLTMTYSGGGGTTANKTFYLNGQALTLSSSGASYGQVLNLPSSALVGIGYDRGRNTAYFDGYIDDVRIYNRALTPTEVSTLYSRGAQ